MNLNMFRMVGYSNREIYVLPRNIYVVNGKCDMFTWLQVGMMAPY